MVYITDGIQGTCTMYTWRICASFSKNRITWPIKQSYYKRLNFEVNSWHDIVATRVTSKCVICRRFFFIYKQVKERIFLQTLIIKKYILNTLLMINELDARNKARIHNLIQSSNFFFSVVKSFKKIRNFFFTFLPSLISVSLKSGHSFFFPR